MNAASGPDRDLIGQLGEAFDWDVEVLVQTLPRPDRRGEILVEMSLAADLGIVAMETQGEMGRVSRAADRRAWRSLAV